MLMPALLLHVHPYCTPSRLADIARLVDIAQREVQGSSGLQTGRCSVLLYMYDAVRCYDMCCTGHTCHCQVLKGASG